MHDYNEQIEQFWPTIIQAWEEHADKRPVIECDLASKTVRAYASEKTVCPGGSIGIHSPL